MCLKLTQMIFPDRPNVIGPKKIKITFRQKYILQGEMIPVISGLVSHLVNLEGNDNWGRGRLVWRGITLLIGPPPPVSRQRVRLQLQTF